MSSLRSANNCGVAGADIERLKQLNESLLVDGPFMLRT